MQHSEIEIVNPGDCKQIREYFQRHKHDWERIGYYLIRNDESTCLRVAYIIHANYAWDSRMERWGIIYYACEQSGMFKSMDVHHFEDMMLTVFSDTKRGSGRSSIFRKSVAEVRRLLGGECSKRFLQANAFEIEQYHSKVNNIVEQLRK